MRVAMCGPDVVARPQGDNEIVSTLTIHRLQRSVKFILIAFFAQIHNSRSYIRRTLEAVELGKPGATEACSLYTCRAETAIPLVGLQVVVW